MKNQNFKDGKIIIYKTQDGPEIEVNFQQETIWLRQNEIAKLYGKERSVITKHIKKIFLDKEIDRKSNVQFLHIPNSDKPVAFYSLDVIFFRKWATKILRNYLLLEKDRILIYKDTIL